jgi:hypothetical protein
MTKDLRAHVANERMLSRRLVVRRGLSVAAGTIATLAVARDGSAAVTPLDVRQRSAPVEDTDSTTTPSRGGGRKK